MTRFLPRPVFAYIDSATTTAFTAALDTWYVVDTAAAAVTIQMPPGGPPLTYDHWIIIGNAPAGGPQAGGTTRGNTITFQAAAGERLDGDARADLGPPTSQITAACRQYLPTGDSPAPAYGPGWNHVLTAAGTAGRYLMRPV